MFSWGFLVPLFLSKAAFFDFSKGKGDKVIRFFSRREKLVFSGFQCSDFFGYFFASFPFQSRQRRLSAFPVIHRIATSTLANGPDCPSLRPQMLYIDDQAAGPTPGQINIITPRLIYRQDGQEHSAYGTGSKEACQRARAGWGKCPTGQEGGAGRRLPASSAASRACVVPAHDPRACAGSGAG